MQKKLSFLLAAILVFTCLLTACGPKDVEEPFEDFSDGILRFVAYEDGWGVAAAEGLTQAEIAIPAEVRGKAVVRIEREGFANNESITSVTIPESVKYIEPSAFFGCAALATVNLHDGVESIGDAAFMQTAYYKNANNWDGDLLYIGKHLVDAKVSAKGAVSVKDGTLTIACHAFANRDDYYGYVGCTGITAVTIPGSVKIIGDGAFQNCTALAEINVPDDVTYIGDYAFQNTAFFNKKLGNEEEKTDVFYIGKHLVQVKEENLSESYTVAAGTLSIAAPAFADCEKLTEIKIPASVTHIGVAAFRNCTALTSIIFEGTASQWNAISKGYAWNEGTGAGALQITYTVQEAPAEE